MWLKTLMISSIMLCTGYAHAADQNLVGLWRTIDDKTGFAKGIVRITQEADGSYSGTIVKVIPRPNYMPKELCQNCPAPYTNQPILGLTVLKGLKPDANRENVYTDAHILDPLSGHIYKAKAKISSDGRRLSMRGYVGVSVLGRSQSWFRDVDEADAAPPSKTP